MIICDSCPCLDSSESPHQCTLGFTVVHDDGEFSNLSPNCGLEVIRYRENGEIKEYIPVKVA